MQRNHMATQHKGNHLNILHVFMLNYENKPCSCSSRSWDCRRVTSAWSNMLHTVTLIQHMCQMNCCYCKMELTVWFIEGNRQKLSLDILPVNPENTYSHPGLWTTLVRNICICCNSSCWRLVACMSNRKEREGFVFTAGCFLALLFKLGDSNVYMLLCVYIYTKEWQWE